MNNIKKPYNDNEMAFLNLAIEIAKTREVHSKLGVFHSELNIGDEIKITMIIRGDCSKKYLVELGDEYSHTSHILASAEEVFRLASILTARDDPTKCIKLIDILSKDGSVKSKKGRDMLHELRPHFAKVLSGRETRTWQEKNIEEMSGYRRHSNRNRKEKSASFSVSNVSTFQFNGKCRKRAFVKGKCAARKLADNYAAIPGNSIEVKNHQKDGAWHTITQSLTYVFKHVWDKTLVEQTKFLNRIEKSCDSCPYRVKFNRGR